MNTQTLTNAMMTGNFVVALPAEEPIYASSRDYGFDFDEEEIGSELLAPLPGNLSSQAIPEVGADDFEQVLRYFLS